MFSEKLLCLIVFFSVASALPRQPDLNGKLRVEKYIKELQLAVKDKAEPSTAPLNQRTFRLPNNTEPISYNIRLSTEIHRGDFGFEGDVTINIRALEATNNITLHSRHTIIERIDLLNPNGTLYQGDVPFIYDSELHFLVIQFIRPLEVGQELTVEISYQGFIRDDLLGLFRNSYNNPVTNQVTWLASTQFSPTNARHAIPCYDEPRYRRPLLLQIRHHRNYSAISNMPVDELIEDGEYVWTVFEETPPMATYTLSFTISDFDFVENTDNEIPLRVYARPEVIQLGEADDALRVGDIMFRGIQGIFGIPYSLSKSDQIALPQLRFAGFEGWGLITHHENFLRTTQRARDLRVSHEYAHIYFGNLVTPSQWSFVWLSEGLAVLYENILITVTQDGENGWEQFLLQTYDLAITTDVLGLLPALNLYAESIEEIDDKFNFGAWVKSAIVLRMIGDAIGNTTFTDGLRNYLLTNQFGNGSPEDLYIAIQDAYDEDNPGNSLNITELMSPWFDLEGFPVVTVRRSGDNLILTQEGFRTLHDELFPIPINYATASHPHFDNAAHDFWMTNSELEIVRATAPKPWTDEDWIIVNLRDSYYYLTNYENDLWDLIIDALNDDHEAIHFLNRGTLFADFHRFIAQDFDINFVIFLRMMQSLPLELHPHVWNRAALGLALAEVRLRTTEFDVFYVNFLRGIMSQIYGEITFDDGNAMNLINDLSCWSGVQECLDDALNILIEVMETGDTDFEFDYQCNGLRAANEATWTQFYNNVLDSTADRSTDLRDLLCTENENLIQFYLNQALNETNNLTTLEREIILTTAATQHGTSSYYLMRLIEYNSEEILEITSVSNLILELAMVTNNYINAELILSLMRFSEDDDLTEDFILQTMQPNMDFIYRNYDSLRDWFGFTCCNEQK